MRELEFVSIIHCAARIFYVIGQRIVIEWNKYVLRGKAEE
jgi:hypothetical protein